jgi:hypothetical protein
MALEGGSQTPKNRLTLLSVYTAGTGANERSADQSAVETQRSGQGARRGPWSAEARLLQLVGNRANQANEERAGRDVAARRDVPVTVALMKSP